MKELAWRPRRALVPSTFIIDDGQVNRTLSVSHCCAATPSAAGHNVPLATGCVAPENCNRTSTRQEENCSKTSPTSLKVLDTLMRWRLRHIDIEVYGKSVMEMLLHVRVAGRDLRGRVNSSLHVKMARFVTSGGETKYFTFCTFVLRRVGS